MFPLTVHAYMTDSGRGTEEDPVLSLVDMKNLQSILSWSAGDRRGVERRTEGVFAWSGPGRVDAGK